MRSAFPAAILLVVVIALLALPLYSNAAVTTYSINNAFQNAASLGFLALGVGLTMIIGEFDLSTLGAYALGGMIAVKFGVDSPVLGVLLAVGAAAVIGGIQGCLIAWSGISSVPLTLGGYIVLLGASHLVSNSDTLAYSNYDAGIWLDGILGVFFSPRIFIVLAIFILFELAGRWTRLGREVKSVGGDRRASRAAGVPCGLVIIGVFICSAVLSSFGGALFSYSTSAAKPDLGLAPFIFAVTAVLLGGVSLAGGRGSPGGILLGVLSLSLLETLFAMLSAPVYIVNLVQGVLLLLVVVFEAPDLRWRIVAAKSRLHPDTVTTGA
jgi:ribose transport system permease protein